MSAKKMQPPRSAASQARADQQSGRRQEGLGMLSALDCLRGVPAGELARLLEIGTFRAFPAGAPVFGQQRHTRFLFLVLRGTLQLKLRDKDGREVLMGVLGRGDCCGEGPLFGDFFRRMSARTQGPCHLLQLPIAELRETLGATPLLATALRHVYKRRMVECTLARVPLLGQMFPMERLALANMLQPAHFPRGATIMRQGEPADALYLIESGQVVVEQNGQAVATLGEGDFFGEMSLLTSQPHRADVRALTPTDVLALPGGEFHHLIDQRPDLEAQLRTVVEQRIRNNAAVRGDQALARELELAVGRGLLRSSHMLARDPSMCPPDCRICEMACADRHGRARLSLNGTPIEGLDVVDTCRQCSVGAECVESCPEDAFERTESGVVRINERCTGCGQCIEACPYDVVAAVPTRAQQPAGGPLMALLRRAGARLRGVHIPLDPVGPAYRADKCDRCHGFADMACVSQCPTGAMRLIAVDELFPI